MATILDGKVVAASIQREVAADIDSLRRERSVTPTLAVVLIGNDPASKVYVSRKRQAAQAVGIATRDHIFADGLSETRTLALVQELNDDKHVHGILVQLPLPKGVDEARVLDAIDPAKDVDGFHPENLGRLMSEAAVSLPVRRPACSRSSTTTKFRYGARSRSSSDVRASSASP